MPYSSSIKIIPVACILLFHKGKVLAAQRSGEMELPLIWEFPGGKVEKGETEKACIIREIQEELGIEIKVIYRFPVFEHDYGGVKLIRLIPFLGIWDSGEISLLEHHQIKWLGKEELWELDWAPADLPIVLQLEQNWDTYLEIVLNFKNKR